MQRYISKSHYEKVLATYSDHRLENNWTSIFLMVDLFEEFAISVARELSFNYNLKEGENGKSYLKTIYNSNQG